MEEKIVIQDQKEISRLVDNLKDNEVLEIDFTYEGEPEDD